MCVPPCGYLPKFMIQFKQMKVTRLKLLACFVALPLAGLALNWPCQPTATVKADCVRFARENGLGEFADRIASQTDTTSWIDETIRFCEAQLAKTQGRTHPDEERRRAFMLLDYPLHVDNYAPTTTKDEIAAYERAVTGYMRRTIARVLREVRAAKVAPGTLRAWHVYNMAYVLKGERKTVLIDFTPYPFFDRQTPWTDDDWQAFAELGDLLVITHPHRDHSSYPLMRRLRALGKPLILPCEMRDRETGEEFKAGEGVVVLDRDHDKPVDVGGVRFWNFMGNQGAGVPCNTYLIDIDGVRIADNGDNGVKTSEWKLAKCPSADLIISSTWSYVTNIVSACKSTPGFDPKRAIFLPSHENEVMHSVPHRESYREMYTSKVRLGCPGFAWPRVMPLAWGESVTFSADGN